MSVNLRMATDGKIKISMGSDKVRIDSVEKFLGRNRDAILVKLEGPHDSSMLYKPGHVCRIEEDDDDNQKYIVFVGKHMIGYLPDEAIVFSQQVNSVPFALVSIVGKVEGDDIYIYIAE